MTDKPSTDSSALARFIQDWTSLWREELQMLAGEAAGKAPDPTEPWRAAMTLWADALLVPPSSLVPRHDSPAPKTGPATAVAAPDPRDGEIERLRRRVDALEARLAELEQPKPRPKRAAGRGSGVS